LNFSSKMKSTVPWDVARDGSALRLLGPELVLGVSRCDIRKRLKRWLISQHWASWRDLGNTLRQARELISGPCPGTRIKLLSFNRNQSRLWLAFLLDVTPCVDTSTCWGC
jgi:hypothetical protein